MGTILQYFSRKNTPFKTIDLIEEYGLEVSTSGRTLDDAYPCLCQSKYTLQENFSQTERYTETWSTSPPQEDIPALTLVIMAVAKYSQLFQNCYISSTMDIDLLSSSDEGFESMIASVK